jgi:hypothetical protein
MNLAKKRQTWAIVKFMPYLSITAAGLSSIYNVMTVKVAPFMGSIFNPYHIFHLSPNLKDRIGKHSWDDD